MQGVEYEYPQWDSNPHCGDFKSPASADWAMGAPGSMLRERRPARLWRYYAALTGTGIRRPQIANSTSESAGNAAPISRLVEMPWASPPAAAPATKIVVNPA